MKAVSVALFLGVIGSAPVQSASAAEAAKFKEEVVWSFGSGTDGQNPRDSLIDVNGTFYGTTPGGGTYGGGTVFSLDPSTGAEAVLYSFCSQQNCADSEYPFASLIDVKGKLYGTTYTGGSTGCDGEICGTVFMLDPSTGAETVLYSFCSQHNCTDGANPWANPIEVKGVLYGTTQAGGLSSLGTVFALDRKTGAETVLHSFSGGTDGQNPLTALIAVNSTLYATTVGGGSNDCDGGCGTVFSLDPKDRTVTVLYSFLGGTDGEAPAASLLAVKGMLYGTTENGGGTSCSSLGCGTVYSFDPSTRAETVLYSFCSQQNCTDGEYPDAGLIHVKGMLYGTTLVGGVYGYGTVFSVDRNTGAENVLHSFLGGKDGAYPQAGLIAVKGTLYGTTTAGGAYGYGTVFALTKR
jgi:uncharacterized repeat protein (TIGR03803 family)